MKFSKPSNCSCVICETIDELNEIIDNEPKQLSLLKQRLLEAMIQDAAGIEFPAPGGGILNRILLREYQKWIDILERKAADQKTRQSQIAPNPSETYSLESESA